MVGPQRVTGGGLRRRIPEKKFGDTELVHTGHSACPGCGAALAMRLALKALGKRTVVVVPASCWSNVGGAFPTTSLRVPLMHTPIETAAAAASGIRAAFDSLGERRVTILAWAGDGGTFDIGFQALSAAAERDENILYACYDNEAYMNTGGHSSGATPWGASTYTTPPQAPNDRPKKNIVEIMAAHEVPYAATATIAYPEDMMMKFKKAKEIKGFRFLHILSPCSPGWQYPSQLTIEMSRLAVNCKIFPLYEVSYGVKYTINLEPEGLPISTYLKAQNRYGHLGRRQINVIQRTVDASWARLKRKANAI